MKHSRLLITMVIIVAAVAFGAFAFLRGSNSRSYAIPEDVCGVQVRPDSLEPLLPEGQEISQSREGAEDSSSPLLLLGCDIDVDGEGAVNLIVERLTTERSVIERYEAVPGGYGMQNPSETTINGHQALVGPDGSLVQIPCHSNEANTVLAINVQLYNPESADPETGLTDMENFTEDFTTSAAATYGCG
jgi:hypothetical protein